MELALNILTFVAIGAVVVVLGLGLVNMFRGGDGNTSQKLMRARVILQAVALVLLFFAAMFFGGRG